MLEYKTIRCDHKNENKCVNIFYRFGWDVYKIQHLSFSSNTIKGGTIYTDYFGDTTVEINTEENYSSCVQITFVRNTNMRNYAKLRSLESQYASLGGFRDICWEKW